MSGSGPTLREAYLKWLKIPEDQLPPDHYAILGLPQFESDAAKIDQATRNRTALVRPKSFKYHEVGTQVLNQIAQAGVCLKNAEEKALYDQSLRAGGQAAARPRTSKWQTGPNAGLPDAAAKAVANLPRPPAATPVKSNYQHERRSRAWKSEPEVIEATEVAAETEVVAPEAAALSENQQAMLLVVGLAVVVLVAFGSLIAYSLSSGSGDDDDLVADVPREVVLPSAVPAGKPVAGELDDWLPKADEPLPPSRDTDNGEAGSGGSGPLPVTPVSDAGGSDPIESLLAADPEQSVATEALERFYGNLVRVEQHKDQIVLAVQVSRSEPIIARDQADAPIAPADPFGSPETQPVEYNFLIGAIARDADFARDIADYESLEERFDQTAGGVQGEFVDAATFAIQGDAVEIIGVRASGSGPPLRLLPGAVAVELRSIQKSEQPETLAEVGRRRATYIDPSVAARRTPLHRLLRRLRVGDEERTTVIPGVIQDASDAANIGFLPDGTTQPVVIRVTTRFPFSQGHLLAETSSHIHLTAAFDGSYDDAGRPVLLASGAQPFDAAVAGSPDGVAAGGIFGDGGATPPGGAEPPSGGPGADVYDPGTLRPTPVDNGSGERWYVVRIFDRYSKSNSWIVVQGRQGQKEAKETYAGDGITVSAERGSYTTYDAAQAAADRLSLTRGPKF